MLAKTKFPQPTQYSAQCNNAFDRRNTRGRFFWLLTPMLSYFLIVLLISSSNVLTAQALVPPLAPVVQTTLAIFTDRGASPMSESLWQALVVDLREELAGGSPETQVLAASNSGLPAGADANAQIQIIRGDQIVSGLRVDNFVVIYLHAECTIIPHPAPWPLGDPHVSGVLGWVKRNHGHIDPFIHVDCARLAQMLATQAFGRNRDQRDQLLANAIARVILHEWIHIATQNPHHLKNGIAKAQFSVKDLLACASKPPMPQRIPSPAGEHNSCAGPSGQPAFASHSQFSMRGAK